MTTWTFLIGLLATLKTFIQWWIWILGVTLAFLFDFFRFGHTELPELERGVTFTAHFFVDGLVIDKKEKLIACAWARVSVVRIDAADLIPAHIELFADETRLVTLYRAHIDEITDIARRGGARIVDSNLDASSDA